MSDKHKQPEASALALYKPEVYPGSMYAELQKFGKTERQARQLTLTEELQQAGSEGVEITGLDLDGSQDKALSAIQLLLARTKYEGNLPGVYVSSPEYHWEGILPGLEFTVPEFLEAYGLEKNDKGAFPGRQRELALDALRSLCQPRRIVYKKPRWEKGKRLYDVVVVHKPLIELIEGRINDKVQYAVDKCLEEMCKDEPFGIYDYGSVEELQKINAQNLYEHYKYFLETLPVYVFIYGDLDDDKIKYIIDGLSAIKRGSIKTVGKTGIESKVGDVKNITERMNVTQGKLCMGFRTNISPDSKDYYKLMVYNSILGGGLHSKLFQNVREKAGLAYYVFSRLEKFKGLMVISSGIEIDNRDKAIEIIKKQLEDIKNGNISDYEYEASIKSMETGVKSLTDSQLQVVDFYLSQYIIGTDDGPNDIIEKVKQVTKQDVVDIADRIELDTLYFLTALE